VKNNKERVKWIYLYVSQWWWRNRLGSRGGSGRVFPL